MALVIWAGDGLLFSQSDEELGSDKHGQKEGWENEHPPGWGKWDEAKKQSWKQGLKRAKDAVKKHEEKKLKAAQRALEKAARKGLPVEQAEKMVKSGLDQGLGADDFGPLGKFVTEKHQQGLKGEDLAEAIHQEVKHRQAERVKARERMKAEKGIGKEKAKKGQGEDKDKAKEEEEDKEEGKGKGNGKGKDKGKDKEESEEEDKEEGKGKGKDKGKSKGSADDE